MIDDPDPPTRADRIAAELAALQRDLEAPAVADPSQDDDLRRRLRAFADLFLDRPESPGPG